MASAKQVARELLDRLPEDCSLEDIQYHLYVRQMVEEGRREIRDGQYFTQEQIERDLASWLEKCHGRPLAQRAVGAWARRPRARRSVRA